MSDSNDLVHFVTYIPSAIPLANRKPASDVCEQVSFGSRRSASGTCALGLIIVPFISFAEPHIIQRWKHMTVAIGMTEVFATVMLICAGLRCGGIV